MDFARNISKYPGIELKAYGPGLEVLYSDLTFAKFSQGTKLEDLRRLYDFDVIILNTKSRMFHIYHAPVNSGKPEDMSQQWLPADINSITVPKVMIEEDYHYEVDNNWYKETVDLVLQRHYHNCKVANERGYIKNIWFPFSVDTDVFKPDGNSRINKVCFSGSSTSGIYNYREIAKQKLLESGLLSNYEQKNRDNDYLLCLQKYVSHLSGCSKYCITPAKMFEIMASGSVLLTNQCGTDYGMDHLFSGNSYVSYSEIGHDIVTKVNILISDEGMVRDIIKSALLDINERHTDTIRIGQLLEILKEEIGL
jgi:hypothetical protein